MKRWAVLILFLGGSGAAWAAAPDCLSCHDDKAGVKDSIHGALGCTGCHASIQAYPHPEKVTPVNCGTCHANNAADLAQSVHAVSGGPSCVTCHGDAHSILPSKNPKSSTNPANLPRTCAACHGSAEKAKQLHAPQVYSLYMDSIHGFALTKEGLLVAASCSSCHGSHGILSHRNPKSRTFRANIPETCGTCHAGPLREFSAGIHGKKLQAGAVNGPVCTNCHTTHQIARVENTAWQMQTTATCGGCHKEKYATYHDTFHAQVSSLGFQQTARCWDCHGYHDILPASDPNSTVAAANLIKTCSKCHTGANAGFVKYDPHANSDDVQHYPALHYAAIFMNLLLSGVLGFFALHTVLWFLRTRSISKHGSEQK